MSPAASQGNNKEAAQGAYHARLTPPDMETQACDKGVSSPNGACVSAKLEAHSRHPPCHPRIRCNSVTLEITPARNFPRNLASDFTHYLSERPEMTSHGGKPRKAKTTKGITLMKTKLVKSIMAPLVATCALVTMVAATAAGQGTPGGILQGTW